MESHIEEIYALKTLLADIIETLTDRDDSVKTWIEEQLAYIETSVPK